MAKKDWRDLYDDDIIRRVENRDYSTGGADAIYMNDEDYAATLYDQSLWEAADAAGRAALHDRTENRRAGYNYSGGVDGSEYIKKYDSDAERDRPSYTQPASDRPSYSSPYQDKIDALLDETLGYGSYTSPYSGQIDAALADIMNRPAFSYDYASDPAYQAYKKEYIREGQRAQEDAMAQYAAMTGGIPSSYAVTAAQQARDYYNAKLSDKIPELYAAAYSMYQNEGNDMLQRLNLLRGLDSDAYGRYGDSYNRLLSGLSAVRGVEGDAYGRYRDSVGDWENDRNFGYNVYQDELGQWNTDRAYDASRADTDYQNELAIAKLKAQYGDYSGLEALGVDTSNMGGQMYAYSDDGSPYEIGSYKGQYFVQNAQPGQTMTGGDGSQWTKDALGNVIITKDGKTYTISSGVSAAPTYYGTFPSTEPDSDPEPDYTPISNASDLGQRAKHVYNTVMSNIAGGASSASMMDFVHGEIEKGLGTTISDEEADYLLRMFGY